MFIVFFILLVIIISGCTVNKNNSDCNFLNKVIEGERLLFKKNKKQETVSLKRIAEFKYPLKNLGNILAYTVDKDDLYLLYKDKILKINLTKIEKISFIIKPYKGDFTKISVIDDQVFLYGGSTVLVLGRELDFETQKKIEFKNVILNLFRHNCQWIFVSTNGKCHSFNLDFSRKIWESVALNEFSSNLLSFVKRDAGLFLLNNKNQLTCIDLDSGSIVSIELIQGNYNSLSLCILNDLICINSDNNLFIKSPSEVQIYYIPNLRKLWSNYSKLFIQTEDKIIISDKNSMKNGNYFGLIDRRESKEIIFHKKCILFNRENLIEVYDFNNSLIGSIPITGRSTILDLGGKVIVLDKLSCSLYEII